MRLIKFRHACVRLESDGGVLVIDPGSFSERVNTGKSVIGPMKLAHIVRSPDAGS